MTEAVIMIQRYTVVSKTLVVCICLVALLVGSMDGQRAFAEKKEGTAKDVFDALQIRRFDEPVEVPDFSLPLIGGGEAKLSDYKGKLVFLNFWATWCPYCRKEREALQATYEKYKEQEFVVLSVSIDRAGSDTVAAFVEEHGLTFPNMHDQTAAVAAEYGVRGIPATYFVNADGKIIGGVIGPRQWDSEDVHALIEELLQ